MEIITVAAGMVVVIIENDFINSVPLPRGDIALRSPLVQGVSQFPAKIDKWESKAYNNN